MELFAPYKSLFVDPGIDEATKQLVERYYKNMEYSDTLGQKLNELQNAPFSGDAEINKNLKSTINTSLEGLANEGAYEHSEKELRKLGTAFNTLAPAISQNYAAYTKANQDLKERLEKKEINAQQYELARVYNTYGYEGLKLDQTGRVDQNTYFSPKTIYNDPKPIDMLSGRFKDLLKRQYGVEDASVGQNAQGKWTYTVGEDTIEFKGEDVTAVVNSVKKDENVTRYINQMGDMVSVNSLAGGSTADALNSAAEGYKDYVAQLETAKGSAKTPEEIKQYDDLIASTSKRMTELQQVINSGDINKMAQTLKEEYVQEKYNEIDAYGNTQRGIQTYKTSEKRDQDYWKAKATHEAMLNMPMTTSSMGEITAATDGTGKSYDEKRINIEKLKTQSEQFGRLAEQTNISTELKDFYNSQKRAADIQIQKIENALEEAVSKTVNLAELEKQDSEIISTLKKLHPNATPSQLYNELKRTFDNPTDKDYLDFVQAYNSTYGQGKFEEKISKVESDAVMSEYLRDQASGNLKSDEYYRTLKGTIFVNNTFNNIDQKLSEAFKEQIVSSQYVNKINMPTVEETIQATNGVNEYFQTMKGQSGRPLKDTEQVILNGEIKYGKDAELQGYTILKWEWSADANNFQIILKNSDNKSITVYMPGEQINQERGINKVLGSPSQKFATEVNSTGFGLSEGKSTLVKGLWAFPYDKEISDPLPLDYKVGKKGGIETVTFYPSGSDKPISIFGGSETTYSIKDKRLVELLNTGDFIPIPKK